MCRLSGNLKAWTSWNPQGLAMACTGNALTSNARKWIFSFCQGRLFLRGIIPDYLLTYCMKQRTYWEAKRFSASQVSTFYGIWKFIIAFTISRHPSLSWARSIQSKPPHPTYWRSISLLSSHLRLGFSSGLFPSGLPTKTLYTPLISPLTAHNPRYPFCKGMCEFHSQSGDNEGEILFGFSRKQNPDPKVVQLIVITMPSWSHRLLKALISSIQRHWRQLELFLFKVQPIEILVHFGSFVRTKWFADRRKQVSCVRRWLHTYIGCSDTTLPEIPSRYCSCIKEKVIMLTSKSFPD